MSWTGKIDGVVDVFRDAHRFFPAYKITRSRKSGRDGYPILGGYHIRNNQGVILPVSLFLREVSRGRQDWKTAGSWAADLKQWVVFLDRLHRSHPEPPYNFDLFAANEDDLLKYRHFLVSYVKNSSGDYLTTDTVQNKLRRICMMYQSWSDWGWYLGSLGPTGEFLPGQQDARSVGLKKSPRRHHKYSYGNTPCKGVW